MQFLNAMQAGSFPLRLFRRPQDAPELHLPISLPLTCWFLPKTACTSLVSLMICISLFFLLLLFLQLLFGRKQRSAEIVETTITAEVSCNTCSHRPWQGQPWQGEWYMYKNQSRPQPKLLAMADGNQIDVCSSETPGQIFILSGQSNMSGRGGIKTKHHKDGSTYKEWDHVVPPECNADRGTIWCLNAKLDWVKAREPLHHDIDIGKTCGLGPGLVFAASLIRQCKGDGDKPAPSIGLVPCAVGGTEIKEWDKGSKLYEQMIKRARFATSNSGALKAILWYQGESDTYSSENVKEFPKKLDSLIKNIRSDLEDDTLPIIQVGITAEKHPFPEFLAEVRRAQMAVNLPGVYYVDAKGLPLLEDNIHLNMHSQVQLGEMLADSYTNNVGGNEASTRLE